MEVIRWVQVGILVTLCFEKKCSKINAILASFVLSMVIHQDVLKKAQEEIDRVIGNERLPDLGDRSLLPYIQCIILEIYR